MSFSHMTNEELVAHCVGRGELTPLEVELFLRLEGTLDDLDALAAAAEALEQESEVATECQRDLEAYD